MTKMPDKIYCISTNGLSTAAIAYTHPETERGSIEYTRSDLIPHPVTDEARAKALEALEDIKDTFDPNEWPHDYDDIMGDIATIKAALSQPVMSDGEKRMQELEDWEPSEESKKQALSFLKSLPDTSQLNENAPQLNQPEAIQKAVEALRREVHALIKQPKGLLEQIRDVAGQGHIDRHLIERGMDAAINYLAKNNKLNIGTHQSELKALKAENADLRRAVVDIYDWMRSDSDYRTKDYFIHRYDSIFTKAKAVQNV